MDWETLDIGALYYILQRVYNMRVAVCDDERKFSDEVRSAVYDYSNMHHLEIAVDSYQSGEALLRSTKRYHMILMDYKMGGINGIETAAALRERNMNCTIIFLTSYPQECIHSAFEVDTFRFLDKPLDVAEFYRALDDYFRKYGNNYPLLLTIDRNVVHVQTNDIMYLEADNKCCYVHLAGHESLHCAKPLAVVAGMVPKSIFFKVHRSFIVNLNYIRKYDKKRHIYFKNGNYIFVSRSYYSAFREAYLDYAGGRVV